MSTSREMSSAEGRPHISTGLSPETIEGRLLAHRNVLALVVAELQRRDGAVKLMAALESLSVMQDHQEDPGAVIGGPEAIQGALAEEVISIVLACSQERSSERGSR